MAAAGFVTWLVLSVGLAVASWMPARLLVPRAALAGAVASLLVLAAIAAIVFGPDDYAGVGTEWSSRGASEHRIFLGFAAIELVLAAVFVAVARRRVRGGALRALVGTTGFFDLIAGFFVVIAFGSN